MIKVTDKKPLKVSELIDKLEEMKKDVGDCEVWMSPQNLKEGDDVEFDSVIEVCVLRVAKDDYSGVLLLPGKEYLRL